MQGTDRKLRSELGAGGRQTHKDVYDPETGGTKRVEYPVTDDHRGWSEDGATLDERERLFLEAVEAGTLVPNVVVTVTCPTPLEAYENTLKVLSEGVVKLVDPDGTTKPAVPLLLGPPSADGVIDVAPGYVTNARVEWVVEDFTPTSVEKVAQDAPIEDALPQAGYL